MGFVAYFEGRSSSCSLLYLNLQGLEFYPIRVNFPCGGRYVGKPRTRVQLNLFQKSLNISGYVLILQEE